MKVTKRDRQVITHLGSPRADVDPKQAAHENRILVCLRKRGTLRENEVKLYTASTHRVGREIHNRAVQHLVEQGLIRKLTTTRANSFILELTGAPVKEESTASSVGVIANEGEARSMSRPFANKV